MPRAVSSALGVLLLTALTLVLAAVAGVAVVSTAPPETASHADVPEPLVLSASAAIDAENGTVQIALVHEGGPAIDVREVAVRIAVDGTRLVHQPAVPFYAASGFASFPSGPFNPVADPHWELGERASLEVTGENAEVVSPGSTVRIELYRDDLPIAAAETTAN
ncbi:MAG TPA: type IV pilin [Halobacteriales archaeon]|nr:type IV pilin [Halobacteriales archaeon]